MRVCVCMYVCVKSVYSSCGVYNSYPCGCKSSCTTHLCLYCILSSCAVPLNNNFIYTVHIYTVYIYNCHITVDSVLNVLDMLSLFSQNKRCDPSFHQTAKAGAPSCAVSETCWKIKTYTWNSILRCWCHSSTDRKRCIGTSLICHIYSKWHLRHRCHIKARGKINRTFTVYRLINVFAGWICYLKVILMGW